MPSLSYYLQRSREQPLRETLNLAQQLVMGGVRKIFQPTYDSIFKAAPTKRRILERSLVPTWTQLTADLKSRNRPALFDLPAASQDVVATANSKLNEPLDWHTDFRSGYKWSPSLHYLQVPLSPARGVDIKNAWDVSRFHDGIILAQAYKQTSQEKYAQEFVRRVLDWIRENPYRYGVNWTSAMESAIRAANWSFAFYHIRSSRFVDEDFVSEFLSSLAAHAEFIKSNLEYREAWIAGRRTRLNSNHYLCDIAGLLFVAVLFPELRLGEDQQFAAAELERELFEQTHSDGVDYEHSTRYHHFVLEIFSAAFSLLQLNAYPVQSRVEYRLAQMRRFLDACAHSETTIPQIGDNDSGRFLSFPLVQFRPDNISQGFSEGGFYSLRGNDSHVLISVSRVGMRGFGSHSHNDVLSFEYWWAGQAWIVDPGTYAYLPDAEARNWFRSTAAHNTVRIDSAEINTFHSESIFQMVDESDVKVSVWDVNETRDVLEACHNGYRKLPGQVRHKRRFEFDKAGARLVIDDALEGIGTHLLEWFFQIHPAVHVRQDGANFLLSAGSRSLKLSLHCKDVQIGMDESWYSPGYGVRVPAIRIVGRLTSALPQSMTIVIEPC